MVDGAPLIEAEALVREYPGRRVVDAVDLTLERGQILGLLGPNGAGKTTTLAMLSATLAPTAGRIAVAGVDLVEDPRRAKAGLGYLPERPPVYDDMTVREFLGFAAALRGLGRDQRYPAADRAIERCRLETVAGRLIGHLSRGYRQRVGIAQALVHAPAAVILDEPTVGLDPNEIRSIRALIAGLAQEHGVILSTHVLPEVESVCSHVMILHDGRVAFTAAMAELGRRETGRFILALAAPPATDALAALPGVSSAQPLGAGRFSLHIDPAVTDPAKLARTAVERGWGLTELTPQRRDLDQVFARTTAREATATGSSGGGA